jgi:spore germination protein YaaH
LTGGSINITDTVVDEYSAARAIAPEKIVLGCPHYGLHWTTTGSAAPGPP